METTVVVFRIKDKKYWMLQIRTIVNLTSLNHAEDKNMGEINNLNTGKGKMNKSRSVMLKYSTTRTKSNKGLF